MDGPVSLYDKRHDPRSRLVKIQKIDNKFPDGLSSEFLLLNTQLITSFVRSFSKNSLPQRDSLLFQKILDFNPNLTRIS